jgi:hypothetical protein
MCANVCMHIRCLYVPCISLRYVNIGQNDKSRYLSHFSSVCACMHEYMNENGHTKIYPTKKQTNTSCMHSVPDILSPILSYHPRQTVFSARRSEWDAHHTNMCASETSSPQNNPQIHMLQDQPCTYSGYTCKPDIQASPSASPVRTSSLDASNPHFSLAHPSAVLKNSFLTKTGHSMHLHDCGIPNDSRCSSPSGLVAINPGFNNNDVDARLTSPSAVTNPPQNFSWSVRTGSSFEHGKCDGDNTVDGRSLLPDVAINSESQKVSIDSGDETWAYIQSQLNRERIKCEYCDSNGRVGTLEDCTCVQHAEASVRGRGSSVGDEDFAVWVREGLRELYNDDDDQENEDLNGACSALGQRKDNVADTHVYEGHLDGDQDDDSSMNRHRLHTRMNGSPYFNCMHAPEANDCSTENKQQRSKQKGQRKPKPECIEARDPEKLKLSSIYVFGNEAGSERRSVRQDEAEIVTLCREPPVSGTSAHHAELPAALCLKDTGNNSEKFGSPGFYPCAYSAMMYSEEGPTWGTAQTSKHDGGSHRDAARAQTLQEAFDGRNTSQPPGLRDENQKISESESTAQIKSTKSQEPFVVSPRRCVDALNSTCIVRLSACFYNARACGHVHVFLCMCVCMHRNTHSACSYA